MSNYYKVKTNEPIFICPDTSLPEKLAKVFLSCPREEVIVTKSTLEEYLNYKALCLMNEPRVVKVNFKTRAGLQVLYVKFPPDDEDDSPCSYIVEDNGYKRIMITSQRNLLGGIL